jgi:hypothetical protein
LYHHPDGYNNLYERAGDVLGIDLASWLTAFQPFTMAPLNERLLVSAILVTVVIAALFLTYLRRPHPET